MMKRFTIVATAVFVVAGTSATFTYGWGQRLFREFLSGLKEAQQIVSTTGNGTFRATINKNEDEIHYVLTFKDLEGDVTQAHIHVGHPQNSGGIVLWLCDSAANPAPTLSTPECTMDDPFNPRAGKVIGTLSAAEVRDLPLNGIAGSPATPEEFAEVIALIRAGKTYVNVHTAKFGMGEIRSQIEDPVGARFDHRHDFWDRE
jgi:hypothetical protein